MVMMKNCSRRYVTVVLIAVVGSTSPCGSCACTTTCTSTCTHPSWGIDAKDHVSTSTSTSTSESSIATIFRQRHTTTSTPALHRRRRRTSKIAHYNHNRSMLFSKNNFFVTRSTSTCTTCTTLFGFISLPPPLSISTCKRRSRSINDNTHINKFRIYARKNTNTNENSRTTLGRILDPLESAVAFLSTPIPNNTSSYSLPLVYPLTIVGLNLLLDSLTSVVILDLTFVLLYTFARSVFLLDGEGQGESEGQGQGQGGMRSEIRGYEDEIENEDELFSFLNPGNKILDLVALFGSIVSTGLISPTGLSFKSISIGLDVENTNGGTIGNSVGSFGSTLGLGILVLCSLSGALNLRNRFVDRFGDDDQANESVIDGSKLQDDGSDSGTNTSADSYSSQLLSEWDRKFKELDD